MTSCKTDSTTILWDAKRKEWYHPSVIMSMKCPHPELKETVK